MPDTYIQDLAVLEASIDKAHLEDRSTYHLPFEPGHPRINELCEDAMDYIDKLTYRACPVDESNGFEYKDLEWKSAPCDTSENMSIAMESVRQAHSQRVTKYMIPVNPGAYGMKEFENAVEKYLDDHTVFYLTLEGTIPQYVNIQWKPASKAE